MVNVFRNNLFQINILRFPKSFLCACFNVGIILSVYFCARGIAEGTNTLWILFLFNTLFLKISRWPTAKLRA